MTEESAIPVEVQEEAPKSLSLLAHERMGSKYHGEVKEAPPLEEQPPEEQEEQELPEAAELEEEQQEEPEGEVISSVDEFVEFLRESQEMDIDPEWFEQLKIKGKVNGEEVAYTINDLKSAAQKVSAADNILESAKEKVRHQQQALQQKGEQVTQHFAVASSLIENMEQALINQIEQVDWETLEKEDPGDFAAKKLRFQEKANEIQQTKMKAAQEYNAFVEEQQEQAKAAFQERLLAEQEALLANLPSWKDAEVANTEKKGITTYLSSLGFSKEELEGAADHRLILMARKAWLYDQSLPTTEVKKKKIAKIPKTLTPGVKKSPAQINQADADAKRQRLRQTGNINDAFALLQARKAQ